MSFYNPNSYLRTLIAVLLFIFISSSTFAQDIVYHEDLISSQELKVMPESIISGTKTLHLNNSTLVFTKDKFDHQYVSNPQSWSAINNNNVCSLKIEIKISTSNTKKHSIHNTLPLFNISDVLLKLGNDQIVNIGQYELDYFIGQGDEKNKKILCQQTEKGEICAIINIPIINSEAMTILESGTNSISKIRVVFNNHDRYIDWVLKKNNQFKMFNYLKKISEVDYNEEQEELVRNKKFKDF